VAAEAESCVSGGAEPDLGEGTGDGGRCEIAGSVPDSRPSSELISLYASLGSVSGSDTVCAMLALSSAEGPGNDFGASSVCGMGCLS